MRQILKRIVETLVVIFGNCIYAFGIAMFILPSGLITGGTTGIALFVNDVFHTPVTVFVFHMYTTDDHLMTFLHCSFNIT